MKPRVAIVILCYNGVEDTLACLRSLQALDYPAGAFELVVVDNASADGTSEAVRRTFPQVAVIETSANLGYAAGNNVGLRHALAGGHAYALLLNNDTEVAPDFLSHLVEVAESDCSVGAAGPTIYYAERPDLIWSAGGVVDWRRGMSRMRGIGERDQGQYAEVSEVDFATGCALLMRRTALEQVGLLDERFFMYYEETEWCARLPRVGMRTVHVPQARLWHKIPVADRVDKPYVAYYMTRNRLLFLRATGSSLTAWAHAVIAQDLRTCLSLTLRRKWRGRLPQRNAMLRAWRDFLTGRFGIAGGL